MLNILLYPSDIHKSEKLPAVFDILFSLFQNLEILFAVSVAPAILVVHAVAFVPRTAGLEAKLIASEKSEATHIGSVSIELINPSGVRYLCLITSLPSSVATKSFSILSVSNGFVSHLPIALTLLTSDAGALATSRWSLHCAQRGREAMPASQDGRGSGLLCT